MKIPLESNCYGCGQTNVVFINLDETSFEWECQCGENIPGYLSTNITTGFKLLYRSQYEITERKDFSLSIVFSATAMECELSRLFFKWRQIKGIKVIIEIEDETLENELRGFRTIDNKIEEIATLMYPRGLTHFVKNNNFLNKTIENGFPSLEIDNLSEGFKKNLFWPRNRVLHLADSSYGIYTATRCFNIATLGLRVLEGLDKERRKSN